MTDLMNTFLNDLKIGKQAENEFINTMKFNYPKYYSNFETNNSTELIELKKWDVRFTCNTTSETKYTEIKWDLKSEKTGNFAIELSYKNEPSGINATIAEHFIIKSGEYFYSFKTEVLKKLVDSNQYRIYNDFQNHVQLCLIPKNEIEHLAKKIKVMNL